MPNNIQKALDAGMVRYEYDDGWYYVINFECTHTGVRQVAVDAPLGITLEVTEDFSYAQITTNDPTNWVEISIETMFEIIEQFRALERVTKLLDAKINT